MCWKELAITLATLLAFDACYFTATREMLAVQIASVQRVAVQMRMIGAIVCYLLLTVGLWYFILRERRSPWEAMLLGMVIYGVFDSTNYTIFKKWTWQTAVMDTLWGGALFAMTTLVVYWFSPRK
uniref:DUF2177 family protein n=1 Tax=viral metagenome TaxID=1070528 RepID=A0A6C0KKH5_9ZZZZ